MNIPSTIYHYTSIESLSLILKSRQIKFSRLDYVNDPQEGISSDYGTFSQYIFVSCWTDLIEESIAFWNIYTPTARGIRIGLKFPALKQADSKTGALIADNDIQYEDFLLLPNLEPITKVEYTNDSKLLYPKILGSSTIQPSLLGRYKSTLWEFESEYRYILYAIPHPKDNPTKKISVREYSNLLSSQRPISAKSVLIGIDEISFDNMIITLGPKTSESDRTIVESLIQNFCPSAKVVESSLKGYYR